MEKTSVTISEEVIINNSGGYIEALMSRMRRNGWVCCGVERDEEFRTYRFWR